MPILDKLSDKRRERQAAPMLTLWVRNLSYRLVPLQRPDEPALMREATQNLWLHGPNWDDLAADLTRRADALKRAS
jgi:hypothetical protein